MSTISIVDLTAQRLFEDKTTFSVKEVAGRIGVGIDTFYRFLRHQKPLPAALLGPLYQATGHAGLVRAALLETNLTVLQMRTDKGPDNPMSMIAELLVSIANLQRLAAKKTAGEHLTQDEELIVKQAVGEGMTKLAQLEAQMLRLKKQEAH